MGEIITFYSYKGGVGRTMALANVAVLLARWGYKVLIVDWDLEAPGLEFYFKGYVNLNKVSQTEGVIDLLSGISDGTLSSDDFAKWKSLLVRIELPKTQEALHFLTAGKRTEDYFSKVRNLDLPTLYADKAGGVLIEDLRNEWKETYDYVLVDSRAGVTDIEGICTVQLPDILMVLFTANEQSLKGVIEVTRAADESRQRLPFDRFSLITVPVPSRFDISDEFDEAQDWLDRFATELPEIYANWLPALIERRDFLEITKIPYISYFSFGEKLAVLDRGANDPTGLGYAYQTLTALIANGLESVEQLMDNRGQYIRQVQRVEVATETEDISITDPSLNVGQLLRGQYQVLETVSATNHSQVVKAIDTNLERPVAIKSLFLDQTLISEQSEEHLLREARILGKLDHPNIGRIYHVILEPLRIVMEWVEGIPLQAFLDEGKQIAIIEVVEIGIKLADALNYLHERNVIHRDIKPSNIILGEDGDLKLIDFDIAHIRIHETISLGNDPQGYVGTPRYSAPEQLLSPGDVGPPTDLFALGLVLYEILTNQLPYQWGNHPSLYEGERLPEPKQFDIPESLYQILCSLLHQQPDQRPTAFELKHQLKKSHLDFLESEKKEDAEITRRSKSGLERHVIFCSQDNFGIMLAGPQAELDAVQFLVDNINTRRVGDYRILVNYRMPIPVGDIEVDIVVINKFGVFLLEVKNWHGFVEAYDDTWLIDGRHQVRNPLQSITHKARHFHSNVFGKSGKLHKLGRVNVIGLVVLVRGVERLINRSSTRNTKAVLGMDGSLLNALSSEQLLFRGSSSDRLTDLAIQQITEVIYGQYQAKAEEIVGNYRILGELSPGDLFDAYEAQHLDVQTRRVRLKRYLLPSLSREVKRHIRHFRRSAETMSVIGPHPNILNTYEFFQDVNRSDTFYEVTEWIDGFRLDEIMTQYRESLSLKQQLAYIEPLCLALSHAHKHKVLHRNLNPQTIFVSKEGLVKLADFDSAKLSEITTISPSSQNKITTPFIAPEIRFNPSSASPASDIYSLGVLWYFLASLPEQHSDFDYSQADQIDLPSIPADARELMRSMFAMSPAERPQDIGEILEYLDLLKQI